MDHKAVADLSQLLGRRLAQTEGSISESQEQVSHCLPPSPLPLELQFALHDVPVHSFPLLVPILARDSTSLCCFSVLAISEHSEPDAVCICVGSPVRGSKESLREGLAAFQACVSFEPRFWAVNAIECHCATEPDVLFHPA